MLSVVIEIVMVPKFGDSNHDLMKMSAKVTRVHGRKHSSLFIKYKVL